MNAIKLSTMLRTKAAIIRKTPIEQASQYCPWEVSNTETMTATAQLKGSSTPTIVVSKVDTMEVGRTSLLSNTIERRTKDATTKGKGTLLVVESALSTLACVKSLYLSLQTWAIF